MGRLALCMAGLLLVLVAAEAAYSPPTYSSPPTPTVPTGTLPPPKKQSLPLPPPKKQTPPPPSPPKKPAPVAKPGPKKPAPVTPPPKKNTPPPPYVHPSPPPYVHTPPPPYVHTPPPPYVHTPPPPYVHTPPPPPTTPPPPPPYVHTPPPPYVPTQPPPPSSDVAAKKVRCKSRASTCYLREFTCPTDCPHSCEVDCHTCSPVCNCNKPGAVCQDPRFIGADGLTFYFHGKKDQDFCLVTDQNLHINGHFIGKRNTNMGRDFTWVQSLGILFDDHQLYIGAQKTAIWNNAVDRLALSFDGQPIHLPETETATWSYTPAGITVTRTRDTNGAEIDVEGKFKIKVVVVPITKKESEIHNYGITNEDCFAHLDLSFKFYSLSGEVNGVLGQTYAHNYVSNVKLGISMPVVGGERKFSTSSLFATDCAVSRFVGENNQVNDGDNVEFSALNCASGINGRGVVCKR